MTTGYELMVDDIDGHLHAAVVHKTKLHSLYVDTPERNAPWAAIFCGKVTKVDKRLNAAIVDIGGGMTGIISAKNATLPNATRPATVEEISDALTPGQKVMVQVKSEGLKATPFENMKMPRLTMKIHVMGQFTHHLPFSSQILNPEVSAVSSWLADKGGWVCRRTAAQADIERVRTEAIGLLKQWQDIRTAYDSSDTPRLLADGPDAAASALRDYGADMFDHIYVASHDILNRVTRWCDVHDAPLATSKRLRLFKPEKPRQRLFDIYEIYGEIDSLHDNRIELVDGGSIVIEQTAALTAIDVNQGNSTDSLVSINLRAAEEICRQIRLRNLSGPILGDFISLSQKSERLQLFNKMETCLKSDPIVSQVHGFTRIGILEITRKRRTPSYAEKVPKIKPLKDAFRS